MAGEQGFLHMHAGKIPGIFRTDRLTCANEKVTGTPGAKPMVQLLESQAGPQSVDLGEDGQSSVASWIEIVLNQMADLGAACQDLGAV